MSIHSTLVQALDQAIKKEASAGAIASFDSESTWEGFSTRQPSKTTTAANSQSWEHSSSINGCSKVEVQEKADDACQRLAMLRAKLQELSQPSQEVAVVSTESREGTFSSDSDSCAPDLEQLSEVSISLMGSLLIDEPAHEGVAFFSIGTPEGSPCASFSSDSWFFN